MTTSNSHSLLAAFDDELAGVAARLRASVVAIRGRSGVGSGTAWEGGFVITNSHVVPDEHARVRLPEGAQRGATVVARDSERDLVALRVEDAVLPAVATRDAGTLRPGELVMAFGHAWGFGGDTTLGVVSATTADGEPIAADVRIAPGNSGGPLADAGGRVIGINTLIANGLAVAIPVATVRAFLASGGGARGLIGVAVVAIAAPPGADGPHALLVTDVSVGGAAESAGLIPGDILIAVDEAGGEVEALQSALRRMRAGDPVRIALLRGGERRTLEVVAAAA